MLALEWPAGVYNIVDDEPVEANVWIPAIVAARGATAPKRVSGHDPIMGRGASNAKAHRVGWSPRHSSWRTSLPK